MATNPQNQHTLAALIKESRHKLSETQAQNQALLRKVSDLEAKEQEWASTAAHVQKEAQCKAMAKQLEEAGHIETVEEYNAKVAELMTLDEHTLAIKKEAIDMAATNGNFMGHVDTGQGQDFNPYGTPGVAGSGAASVNPYASPTGGVAPPNAELQKAAQNGGPPPTSDDGVYTTAYAEFWNEWNTFDANNK